MKLKLKVRPNSGKQSIEEKEGFYVVNLKSAPENNKANIELIKFLEKHFNKKVVIKAGFNSRKKVVEII
jgi:hypothetical protein